MAKVADYPPGSALTGAELFYAVQSDADCNITADQIKTFATPPAPPPPTSLAATGSIGYTTTAGGTVTQATNKATGVTLNKLCGQITTNAAALAAAAEVVFIVTNNQCAATDCVIVNHASGGTLGSYGVYACGNAAGSFRITITNLHTASRSEALVLNFAIIKAANQ